MAFLNRHNILLLLVALLFTLQSCKVRRPSDIIEPKIMEELLYDYHMAKALVDDEGYQGRYKKSIYAEFIYKKYNVTKEKFDHSMQWYSRHLPELTEIYEKLSKRVTGDMDEIDQLVAWQFDTPLTTEPGDTVDIWAWHQVYRLTGKPLTNKVLFTLPTDSNFVEGDSIAWHVYLSYRNIDVERELQFKNKLDSILSLDSISVSDSLVIDSIDKFLTADSIQLKDTLETVDSISKVKIDTIHSIYPAIMQLALYFKNDSSMIKTQPIVGNGMHELSLVSDSLGVIQKIQGFIYLPPQKGDEYMLIDSIALFRYHPVLPDSLLIDSLRLDSLRLDSLGLEVDSLRTDSVTNQDILDTINSNVDELKIKEQPDEDE